MLNEAKKIHGYSTVELAYMYTVGSHPSHIHIGRYTARQVTPCHVLGACIIAKKLVLDMSRTKTMY